MSKKASANGSGKLSLRRETLPQPTSTDMKLVAGGGARRNSSSRTIGRRTLAATVLSVGLAFTTDLTAAGASPPQPASSTGSSVRSAPAAKPSPFIRISPTNGESSDDKHKHEIEVL